MSLQRTPPGDDSQKYVSNPDISHSNMDSNILNRKRKQPEECGCMLINKKFDDFFSTWHSKVDEMIVEKISQSFKTILSSELSLITDSLKEVTVAITGLRSDCTSLQNSMKDMDSRLLDMEKASSYMAERQDSLDARLTTIETKMSHMNALPDQVQHLEIKLAAFEQQARECNIEISNLPERQGENLLSIVAELGTTINYQIMPSSIISAHRVPHATNMDKRPKNVIVKFHSRIFRDNLLAACRTKKGVTSEQLSINGASHKIFVNEHLTLNNKQIFRETRERARMHQYKYVWVKHGVILARKSETTPVVAVRTKRDITKIQ